MAAILLEQVFICVQTIQIAAFFCLELWQRLRMLGDTDGIEKKQQFRWNKVIGMGSGLLGAAVFPMLLKMETQQYWMVWKITLVVFTAQFISLLYVHWAAEGKNDIKWTQIRLRISMAITFWCMVLLFLSRICVRV